MTTDAEQAELEAAKPAEKPTPSKGRATPRRRPPAPTPPADGEPTKPRLRVRPRRYVVQLEAVADDGGEHVIDISPVTFGIPAGELAAWVADELPKELASLEEKLNAGRSDA